MSDDILIDGKPLSSLRVVDLREELKKRGIKSSGSKAQLQELLIKVLTENRDETAPGTEPPPPQSLDISIGEANDTVESKTDTSKDSDNSAESIPDEHTFDNEKVASISINEEKETIKLTIRSSPRKSEPFQNRDSETEDSQSEEMASEPSDGEPEAKVVNASKQEISTKNVPEAKQSEVEEETHEKVEKTTEKSHQKELETTNTDTTEATVIPKPETELANENEMIKMDGDTSIDSETTKITETRSRINLKERLSTQKSIEEAKPVQRKRRWVGSQSKSQSTVLKGISSDQLNELINDTIEENDEIIAPKVSKPSEEDVKLDEAAKTESKTIVKESGKLDLSFKIIEGVKITSQNGVMEEPKQAPSQDERSVSPAKNTESTVLFITGLVRPYTLMQLKKLLSATGKMDEEKFWIDKIKSKCYVVYSSVEEAVETRKALHNLKWPQSSPKNLHVEFATLEDIDRCMNPENYKDLPAKIIEKKSLPNKEANIKGKYDIVIKDSTNEKRLSDNQNRDIREWDRDKIRFEEKEVRTLKQKSGHSSPPASSSSFEKQRKEKTEEQRSRDQRDRQKEKPQQQKEESTTRRRIEKSESPPNVLEDLFRKTKTLPHIYWLPLTEPQMIERAKERSKMEKERQTRMTERFDQPPQRRSSPTFRRPMRGRSPPKRRSPSPIRRKPATSFSPRRRYSRSRSPDRRRFSPKRR